MKRTLVHLTLSLLIALSSGSSYGFPYSKSSEVQVYNNIPDELLSSFSRACIEKSKKKGIMSQLANSLGCSNFRTAKKVCGCVDRVFSKEKIAELVNGEEIEEFNSFIGQISAIDETSLSPNPGFVFSIYNLNNTYSQLGLKSCSFSEDDYALNFSDKAMQKKKKVDAQKVARQNLLFNRFLKNINTNDPTDEELLEIASNVSKESKEEFFLETILVKLNSSASDESSLAINDITKHIIKDYVRTHLSEINNGDTSKGHERPDSLSLDDVNVAKKGCTGMAYMISLQKDKDIEDTIKKSLDLFFPDSSIEKAKTPEEKDLRTHQIESGMADLYGMLAMSNIPEYKKDIFYCSRYNYFKSLLDETNQNEPLKQAIAKLEILKDVKLLGARSEANSAEDPYLLGVLKEVSDLENEIMTNFSLSKKQLKFASTALKIWKVEQGVDASLSEDGKVTFLKKDPKDTSNNSLSEKISFRMSRNEKSRQDYFAKSNKLQRSSSLIAEKIPRSISPKVSSRIKVSKEPTSQVSETRPVRADNYFNQTSSLRKYSKPSSLPDTRDVQRSNFEKSFNQERTISAERTLEERLNKLKQEQLSTEKALSDELTSTKESLEISKLREELRKQSAEISKLKATENDIVPTSMADTTQSVSAPLNFKSPLASALDNSVISSSDDSRVRPLDISAVRASGAESNYNPPVDTSTSNEQSLIPSSSSTFANSSSDDNSSISGISLSSLRSIGDDVQIIEGFNYAAGKPIIVDASFIELSEEQKRARIEELLSETDEDEVFIEFPDGKILKFSKKDSVNGNDELLAKEEEDIKEREKKERRAIFSYDNLKDIIDRTKE